MAEGLLGRLSGRGASSKSDKHFEVEHSDEEWRRTLNPEQYRVLRQHGTERAGTSPLDKQHGAGIYHCAACGQPLFDAGTKFNSGTGWPSFWAPLENGVETETDRSFFMSRTEVHCRRCGGHLGHVFEDGPKPTGLRYCMNGASLPFPQCGRGKLCQTASRPRSPVRMRNASSTEKTKILPSPILSVLAACWIASTARGISASSSTTSIFTLGRKSMTYSAPR